MADRAPDLLLIDGNSLAYRAFFALPESIATSTGEPTNAIFGFSSMLVKLVETLGHVPTAVAWDAGLSGRGELYPEYKAQRDKKPDLLRAQWPQFAPITEAFGYANVKLAGYEADDVIGTLARKAREKGLRTVIVTGDRDIFQLIDPDGLVGVMATGRGITETKTYDYQAVVDRYGLPPELIPDFYGLKGDTSDNIPGVPGIGDKTGAQLLQQFGDLEGVLSSIDQVSGAKRKENLANHAENARISRELARIQTDLDIELDLDALLAAKPDPQALRESFMRFELRDPWRRLEPLLETDGRPTAESVAGGGAPLEVPIREIALDELAAALAAADGESADAAPEPAAASLEDAISAEQGTASDAGSLPRSRSPSSNRPSWSSRSRGSCSIRTRRRPRAATPSRRTPSTCRRCGSPSPGSTPRASRSSCWSAAARARARCSSRSAAVRSSATTSRRWRPAAPRRPGCARPRRCARSTTPCWRPTCSSRSGGPTRSTS